jgi:hypothetical protein
MACDALPDGDEMRLLLGAVVEPGVSAAVVNVCAGLTAGGCMHIDDDVKTFLTTPLDDVIQQGEAFGVVCLKELIVNGNTDGVEAGLTEEMNVFASDVVFAILMPEICCLVRAEQLVYEAFDLAS